MTRPLPPAHPFQRSISSAVLGLAQVLYLEARFESVTVKEAIAATVMNRSGRNGRQAACPGRRPFRPGGNRNDPAFASCLRIAARAINGTLKDPTSGATLYHPKSTHPGWAWRRAPLAEIGNFLFYGEAEPVSAPPASARRAA
ncbi:MAG: cell wall hydrolase [Alphaproteobacteria bacterium]|nr:cell wall hydrolase [Alphaproteobacteria bacterium]